MHASSVFESRPWLEEVVERARFEETSRVQNGLLGWERKARGGGGIAGGKGLDEATSTAFGVDLSESFSFQPLVDDTHVG
jgi:hypothetical protein